MTAFMHHLIVVGQQWMRVHPVFLYTLLFAMGSSVERNMLFRLMTSRKKVVDSSFWSFIDGLYVVVPDMLWLAAFLQLLGWDPTVSLVCMPAMLFFNWLYSEILKVIIHWTLAGALLGSAAAFTLEVFFRSRIQLPLPRNFLIYIAVGVTAYFLFILVLMFLVFLWPRKPVEATTVVEKSKVKRSFFNWIRVEFAAFYRPFKELLYEALQRNFFAGGMIMELLIMMIVYQLDTLVMNISRIMLWICKGILSLFQKKPQQA